MRNLNFIAHSCTTFHLTTHNKYLHSEIVFQQMTFSSSEFCASERARLTAAHGVSRPVFIPSTGNSASFLRTLPSSLPRHLIPELQGQEGLYMHWPLCSLTSLMVLLAFPCDDKFCDPSPKNWPAANIILHGVLPSNNLQVMTLHLN